LAQTFTRASRPLLGKRSDDEAVLRAVCASKLELIILWPGACTP
jgi:hypothetical protein